MCPEVRKFNVLCHVGNTERLELVGESALVQIEQKIRREGREEMWTSLQVKCKELENGSLAVEVVICNPDWDEPRRIALIESNPTDRNPHGAALKCDCEIRDI